MVLKGFATKSSTISFSEKHKEFSYNLLGKTDLFVSEVGFGSYRTSIHSKANKEALKKALLSGINLIDTSSTYTDGNSELLIGEVLQELTNSNKLSRDSLVIITKGGYIQGNNFELSQARKKENKPFADLVEYQQGLEHCIHPEFLQDQITRSLERLGIETIDVYMLHNPEYYLKWAQENGIAMPAARKEYYSRIKKAFEHLEKEVKNGRIKNYGISSNTFPLHPDDFDFTSLDTIIKIAEGISPDNHFCVAEFPMNLAEAGAYKNNNQPNNLTILDLAQAKNIGVLINRPLNAIYDNKLVPLTEPTVKNPPSKQNVDLELGILNNFEKVLSKKLKTKNEEFLSELEPNLFVSKELKKDWFKFKMISSWQGALNQYFLPRLYYCKNLILNKELKDKSLESELINFTFKTYEVFELITAYFNNEHLILTKKVKRNLMNSAPELTTSKNLSTMAIHALRATPGITTILVGMIQPSYVTDVVDELKTPISKDFGWNNYSLFPQD